MEKKYFLTFVDATSAGSDFSLLSPSSSALSLLLSTSVSAVSLLLSSLLLLLLAKSWWIVSPSSVACSSSSLPKDSSSRSSASVFEAVDVSLDSLNGFSCDSGLSSFSVCRSSLLSPSLDDVTVSVDFRLLLLLTLLLLLGELTMVCVCWICAPTWWWWWWILVGPLISSVFFSIILPAKPII